jgi:hypothetical protein
MTVAEYRRLFSGKEASALERAHAIRQFEIELYWKRAAYFWAFIGAAFAGYVAIAAVDPAKLPDKPAYQFTVACIGFVFSFAWYLVNRGSKFWQENWERQIDLLEDGSTGPLQKTILGSSGGAWRATQPYRFSVTRVNTGISIYVVTLWLLLTLLAAATMFDVRKPFRGSGHVAVLAVTLIAAGWILRGSSPKASPGDFHGTTSTVEDDDDLTPPAS